MLVAVIWFVALLALVAAITSAWMSGALGRTAALQDRLSVRAATISAVDLIGYQMSSNYFSSRGLENMGGKELEQLRSPQSIVSRPSTSGDFIALDGRPYRLGAGVVRLQDDMGLLNLNGGDRTRLARLLGQHGLDPHAAAALADSLARYVEGAKSAQFGARIVAPPAADEPSVGSRYLLRTPWEAARIESWDAYPALWGGPDALPNFTTVANSQGLNVNTAPIPVLRSLVGVDADAAARIADYRAKRPILSPDELQLAAGTGISTDPLTTTFFPARSLRLQLLYPNDPLMHIVAVRVTGAGTAPFRIEYAVDLPFDAAARAVLAQQALPAFPVALEK